MQVTVRGHDVTVRCARCGETHVSGGSIDTITIVVIVLVTALVSFALGVAVAQYSS